MAGFPGGRSVRQSGPRVPEPAEDLAQEPLDPGPYVRRRAGPVAGHVQDLHPVRLDPLGDVRGSRRAAGVDLAEGLPELVARGPGGSRARGLNVPEPEGRVTVKLSNG